MGVNTHVDGGTVFKKTTVVKTWGVIEKDNGFIGDGGSVI